MSLGGLQQLDPVPDLAAPNRDLARKHLCGDVFVRRLHHRGKRLQRLAGFFETIEPHERASGEQQDMRLALHAARADRVARVETALVIAGEPKSRRRVERDTLLIPKC